MTITLTDMRDALKGEIMAFKDKSMKGQHDEIVPISKHLYDQAVKDIREGQARIEEGLKIVYEALAVLDEPYAIVKVRVEDVTPAKSD